MSQPTFEQSQAEGGVHSQLQRLVGQWEGRTRTWFEPDKVEDESPWRGTLRAVLGGRFVLHEYEGSFQGKPLSGLALYGYHLETGRYEMAWVDSFHTGTFIMHSSAKNEERGYGVRGRYLAPPGPPWGWRTEIQLPGPDQLVITHYNIPPEGQGPEVRSVETVYRRVSSP